MSNNFDISIFQLFRQFLQVREDGLVLRQMANGVGVAERLFYEQLVNMTFSPKTRVICLWQRSKEATQVSTLVVVPFV